MKLLKNIYLEYVPELESKSKPFQLVHHSGVTVDMDAFFGYLIYSGGQSVRMTRGPCMQSNGSGVTFQIACLFSFKLESSGQCSSTAIHHYLHHYLHYNHGKSRHQINKGPVS